VKRFRQPTGES
jgi:hypothetical protein